VEELRNNEFSFKDNCYISPQSYYNSDISPDIRFGDLINMQLTSPLLIMGFSGIGKSTFINANLIGLNIKYTIFDISISNKLKDKYLIQDWLDNNFNKFYLLKQVIINLLNNIYNIFCIEDADSFKYIEFRMQSFNDSFRHRLRILSKNIKKYFDRPGELLALLCRDIDLFIKDSISFRGRESENTIENKYASNIINKIFTKIKI